MTLRRLDTGCILAKCSAMLPAPPDRPDPRELELDLRDPANQEIVAGENGVREIGERLHGHIGTETLHHDDAFGYIVRYRTSPSGRSDEPENGTVLFWGPDGKNWMIATYPDFEFYLR